MASYFQFSVRSLLVGVTIACVGIAALLNAGPWWEAAVWSGTLLILSFSILLIVYRRREGRAFWLGFAVLGWLYAGVVVHSWTPYANPNYARRDPLAQQSLITTRLAQLAYDSLLPKTKTQQRIPPPATATNQGLSESEVFMANEAAGAGKGAAAALLQFDVLTFTTLTAGTTTVPNPSYVPIASFLHIAHALWLLLISLIGGRSCQLIYRTAWAAAARHKKRASLRSTWPARCRWTSLCLTCQRSKSIALAISSRIATSFSPDEKTLAFVCDDASLRLWDLAELKPELP